jgi:hypothetical protein
VVGVVDILHTHDPTHPYLYNIAVFPSVAAVFGLLVPEHEGISVLRDADKYLTVYIV